MVAQITRVEKPHGKLKEKPKAAIVRLSKAKLHFQILK